MWIRIESDTTADLFRVREGDEECTPDRVLIDITRGQKAKIKIEFKGKPARGTADKKARTHEAQEFFANAQIRAKRKK